MVMMILVMLVMITVYGACPYLHRPNNQSSLAGCWHDWFLGIASDIMKLP